jgi:hypothetical protein
MLDLTDEPETLHVSDVDGHGEQHRQPGHADASSILGQTRYDVKQGRTKLQMQVGSIGLQLFKADKPFDTILLKDMTSWTAAEEVVHIDLASSKRLSYTAVSERDAESIVEQMTTTARALAKRAKSTSPNASSPPSMDSSTTLKGNRRSSSSSKVDSNYTDNMTSAGGVDIAAVQLGTGLVQYDVRRDKSRGAKGGNIQLQVGSLALQMFKGGKHIENVLLEKVVSWGPEGVNADSVGLKLNDGSIERFTCKVPDDAKAICDTMTLRAKELRESKDAAKRMKRREAWADELQSLVGTRMTVTVATLDLREEQSIDADVFQALNEGEEVVVQQVARLPASTSEDNSDTGDDDIIEDGCLFVRRETPEPGFTSVKSGWVNLKNAAGEQQLEAVKPTCLTELGDVSAG